MNLERRHALPVLTIGLLAISFASVLIKLCTAPALVIALYRLAIASALFGAVKKWRREPVLRSLDRRQAVLAFSSGLFLAAHFGFWITSLDYTSVASSVVLVQTAPVFVAVGGVVFLREKPKGLALLGILVTLIGAYIIGWHDFSAARSSLTGNIFAVIGAMAVAGYLLIGRKLRPMLDTMSYVSVVYGVAAAIILIPTIFKGYPLFDYRPQTFILLVTIALAPQVLGHTSLNWALKYFSAAAISILTLTEPVGASILALIILKEKLTLMKIVGGLVILAGVATVLLSESKE